MADFFNRKQKELGVSLNDIQKRAVLQTEGPLLLLASPGSGKTTTIIMKIGYLIEEKGVDASRIKAVTFSNASANDMKERFNRFFPHLQPVDFSTIHSFAFEVVRDHFRKKRIAFQIIEGDLQSENNSSNPLHKKLMLKKLYQSIVGENITEDQMDELTTYISFIKNKMLTPDKWSSISCNVPEAKKIALEYEELKKSHHSQVLLDFDDMLTIGNEILGEDKQLLWKYQQRYDYLLTDESQDTSLVQHAIIGKLVKRHQNLCVVADDDQSIYSWRGAEPSYLLDFKKDYPEAVTLFMEQNYRSSQNIVDLANLFIKRNKNRYEKNMFTKNPSGQPVKIEELLDFNEQSRYLVKEIKDIKNIGEVAILYRNNSSSIELMNQFERAGIPFYMKDADNRFFSHWVVKDILNFMRMTFTDKRPDLLEKIHMKFNGYISKQQMIALKQFNNNESLFDNLLNFVPLQDYQVKHIQASKETFQEMKGMPPLHAIQVIRSRLGYEKALERICESLGFRMDYLIGILNTLEGIADKLETLEQFAGRLKHLESVLKKARYKKGQNVVTLSTFHSSKGLEFERVYMIDLVKGVIPSSDDKSKPVLMEEATRLFYVGMTRAKKNLVLISYSKKDGKATSMSDFVIDVKTILDPPKEKTNIITPVENSKVILSKQIGSMAVTNEKQPVQKNGVPYNPNAIKNRDEIKIGKVVKHRVFGTGTITKVEEESVTIMFSSKEKTLSIVTCLEIGLLEAM